MIREIASPLLDEMLPLTSGARILIVEDEFDQREWLDYRFRLLGFETILAATGTEGLDLARKRLPDVVVLDAWLPDLDGREICRRLADDSSTCEIPVILVSGLDQGDMVRSARRAGCRFFLRKPYDPNALLALVECALQRSNLG